MVSCICNHLLLKNPPHLYVYFVISSFMCKHFVLKSFPSSSCLHFKSVLSLPLFSVGKGRLTFSESPRFKSSIPNHSAPFFSSMLQRSVYRSLPHFASYCSRRHTKYRLLKRRTGTPFPNLYTVWRRLLFWRRKFRKLHIFFGNHVTVTCLCLHRNRLTKFSCLPTVMYWRVNIRAFLPLGIVLLS